MTIEVSKKGNIKIEGEPEELINFLSTLNQTSKNNTNILDLFKTKEGKMIE